MTTKIVNLSQIGRVYIKKNKKSKNLRIRIQPNGEIIVSQPSWIPYAAGIEYAISKKDWIKNKVPKQQIFASGNQIGRSFSLQIIYTNKVTTPKSRISGNQIVIKTPLSLSKLNPEIQRIIEKAAIRALKIDAEKYLLPRVGLLANKHAFKYQSISIKKLHSRWGSCDTNKNISLSLYLVQLPQELIDYVILHELTHTQHMNHSNSFWNKMIELDPSTITHKKEIKKYRPIVYPI
jgi:predicted metal-dependent hydrolase